MARFRRSMAMRPVNRIKHVVDGSATQAAAANGSFTLALATDTPSLANTANVETGSTVNAIYLKVECASNEVQDVGAIPNVYLIVYKDPGGNLTAIVPNAVGANDNKRYVIHQEMLMLNNDLGGNPRTLFNGVIVIPKGYKRFAPNDRLLLKVLSPALDIAVCFQCHYKEFR